MKNTETQRTVPDDRLVQALFELRDALVNASLLLQDIEFQIDRARRMEAARDSNALIERVRSF